MPGLYLYVTTSLNGDMSVMSQSRKRPFTGHDEARRGVLQSLHCSREAKRELGAYFNSTRLAGPSSPGLPDSDAVRPHSALQVQSKAVGVGLSDDKIVLVDNEEVPLAVDALLPVVAGEGGFEPLGLVATDGVVDEEPGLVGGGGPRRDGGHHALRYPFSLGGGECGLRSGDGGDGVLDYPLDLALGQTRFRPGHVC